MTTMLLVGMVLGWGTAWLFRVGRVNHRRFLAAKQFAIRPLIVSAACLALCAWPVGVLGYSALTGAQ